MLIELPCGLLKDGVIYDQVNVEEIKGKQQNYLQNVDMVLNNFGHVPKMIEDLALDYQTKEGLPSGVAPKDAVWLLPTEDIEVILLKIRQFTYGNVYAMPTVCSECGKQQFKKIILDSLEIKPIADKKIRTKVIHLPKMNVDVEVKLLYLKDLFDMFGMMKDQKASLFTATVALSVMRLGDKSPIVAADLESIPVTDLQLIEDSYMALRGNVDLQITHTCDECKKDYQAPLPVMDPLFFAQSVTPTT
jgi:hypothetical protein